MKGKSDIKNNTPLKRLKLANFILLLLITIISATFFNKWDDTSLSFDNLSPNYLEFSIGYNPEIIDKNNYDFTHLLHFLSLNLNSFRLQKPTDHGYSWIFTYDCSLGLELVSGREFDGTDFELYKNVAIISEDLVQYVFYQDSKEWITLDNGSYEVIGVFRLKENSIYKNATAFLNIVSENYLTLGNQVEGKYYLDTPTKNNDILQKINSLYSIIENENIFNKSYKERFELTKDMIIIPINILFTGFLFIVLSIIYITSMWLLSLRKEIYIRRLSGATCKNIVSWILINYIKTIFTAFFFVCLLVAILSIKIKVLLSSVFIMLLIGFINCILIVLKYNNTRIISLK